jgi:hypothetical protein
MGWKKIARTQKSVRRIKIRRSEQERLSSAEYAFFFAALTIIFIFICLLLLGVQPEKNLVGMSSGGGGSGAADTSNNLPKTAQVSVTVLKCADDEAFSLQSSSSAEGFSSAGITDFEYGVGEDLFDASIDSYDAEQEAPVTLEGTKKYNGDNPITFQDAGFSFLEFNWDFCAGPLSFDNIKTESFSEYSFRGEKINGLIINVSGKNITNKTMALTKKNYSNICLKDKEISSLDEISSTCTDDGEIDFSSCIGATNGVTIRGITCRETATTYSFSAVNHSGVTATLSSESSTSGEESGSGESGGGGGKTKKAIAVEVDLVSYASSPVSYDYEHAFTETYYPYQNKEDHFLQVTVVYIGDNPPVFSPVDVTPYTLTACPLPDRFATLHDQLGIYGIIELHEETGVPSEAMNIKFNMQHSWVEDHGGEDSLALLAYTDTWESKGITFISQDETYTYYKSRTDGALCLLLSGARPDDPLLGPDSSVGLHTPAILESPRLTSSTVVFFVFNITILSLALCLVFYFVFVRKKDITRRRY